MLVDIVQTAAIIYVANLLRIAAKTLTKDMRAILAQLASATARIDELEAVNARRNAERFDAKPREGS